MHAGHKGLIDIGNTCVKKNYYSCILAKVDDSSVLLLSHISYIVMRPMLAVFTLANFAATTLKNAHNIQLGKSS
jgi:hypothetical protein